MKTRKMILCAAIAVLALIYAVQLIVSGRNPIKTYSLDKEFDTITLESVTNGTVTLTKEGDGWVVGEKAYEVDENELERIASNIRAVKSLGAVSRSTSEDAQTRFGLDDANRIKVTAFANGKVLRTLFVGKTASSGDQTYCRLDSSSETFLASGTLKDIFGATENDIRTKEIYDLNADTISTVHSGSSTPFTLTKAESAEGAIWSLSGESGESTIDSAKVTTWVSTIASLSAESWANEETVLPTESEGRIELTSGTNKVSVIVTKIGSGDDAKYLCASSETQYLFYISKANALKLLKGLNDLKK